MPVSTKGAWITGTDPHFARIVSRAGFDWIALDLQHGRLDDAAMVSALALTDGDVRRWVRVRTLDAGLIGRALDAGADGVIVPMVDSVEHARRAVAASAYPPRGSRSWGPFHAGYSDPEDAVAHCAVMIESASALAVVEEIAAVPGVDMLFVGPFDLALALGVGVDDLLHGDGDAGPLARIAAAAHAARLRAGAFAGDAARAARLFELGFDDVAVITDAGLLALGAASALA